MARCPLSAWSEVAGISVLSIKLLLRDVSGSKVVKVSSSLSLPSKFNSQALMKLLDEIVELAEKAR